MGGNTQPQPGPQINPVLHMLWPIFAQGIHDMAVHTPKFSNQEIVDSAWEIANRAFQRMGFEFVFPMACRIIPPAALHESDREHAEAAEAAATQEEGPTDVAGNI